MATEGTNTGHAQLRLRVQSNTQLDVQGEQRDAHTLLSGRLLDSLGTGIAGATVRLRVREYAENVKRFDARTQADGEFALEIPRSGSTLRVEASFAGSALLKPSVASVLVRPSRHGVTLSWKRVPKVVKREVAEHAVEIRADSSGGAAALTIDLTADGRYLASARTDDHGLARFALDPARLPGDSGTLTARSRADRTRSSSSLSHPYVRQSTPRLTLRSKRLPGTGGVTLAGRLTAEDDRGLAKQPIGIFRGDVHIKTLLTDETGTYKVHLSDAVLFGSGPEGATQARFNSTGPTLADARSGELALKRPAPPPSRSWLLLTLLLPSAWWLLRRRAAGGTDAPVRTDARRPREASVVARGRARRLARDLYGVSGTVFQAGTGTPLDGTSIALTPLTALDPHTCVTDALGRFDSAPLAPGRHRLEVSCPGHESLELVVEVPHRGEWTGLAVRLRNLRDMAWNSYAPVARAAGADRDPVPTAREAVGRLRQRLTNRVEVEALGSRVERAVYGPVAPAPTEVAEIAESAAKTLDELGRDSPK